LRRTKALAAHGFGLVRVANNSSFKGPTKVGISAITSAVLGERVTSTDPDVLRELLATFIYALIGAEADALCGAGYGQHSSERTNSRHGCRHHELMPTSEEQVTPAALTA
jgi:hypothetical protein